MYPVVICKSFGSGEICLKQHYGGAFDVATTDGGDLQCFFKWEVGVFRVGAFQSDVLINYAVCKLYENINLVLGLKNLQYLFRFYKLILEY